jgi:RNA polymerase sigma-70 factor (sigma-E family)
LLLREAECVVTDFEGFVRDRGRDLMRFAAAVTADAALAEDVVQTVLMRVHQDWDRIASMTSTEGYVRRAVLNEYLSWRRKWSRVVPSARMPELADPRDQAEEIATRSALAGQVAELPPRQRAALVLRFYNDMTDTEIAEVLGCRPVTVRGYVSRALRTLRIELTDSDTEGSGLAHRD